MRKQSPLMSTSGDSEAGSTAGGIDRKKAHSLSGRRHRNEMTEQPKVVIGHDVPNAQWMGDYVCDGIDDIIEIKAAMESLPWDEDLKRYTGVIIAVGSFDLGPGQRPYTEYLGITVRPPTPEELEALTLKGLVRKYQWEHHRSL